VSATNQTTSTDKGIVDHGRPQRAPFSNSTNVADEMFTEAKIDALNSKLIEHGISADQVIAILPVEARIVANPSPPRSSGCFAA
jgi:hypothetical protein